MYVDENAHKGNAKFEILLQRFRQYVDPGYTKGHSICVHLHAMSTPIKPTRLMCLIFPSLDALERVLQFVASRAETNVNVKLDRMVTSTLDSKKKITMLQSYCDVDRYLTLFDIGISGVGASLEQRRGFEHRLFGTAYDGLDHERPRYGSLNLMTHFK